MHNLIELRFAMCQEFCKFVGEKEYNTIDMKNEAPTRIMPKDFRLCIKSDFPRAAECLRSVALQLVSPNEQSIHIINPSYLAAVEGDCPVFRSATKVRMPVAS